MRVEVKGMKSMKSMKSFGKAENRKLGNFLIIACTILSLCILSLVKVHYCPNPSVKSQAALKLQVSSKAEVQMVTDASGEDSPLQEDEDEDEDEDEGRKLITEKPKPICYESSPRSDTCEAEGDIRVQGSSKTVFLNSLPPSQELKIKPYTRKHDLGAMAHIREWSLKSLPNNDIHSLSQCTKNYTSPALIFSIGGFTGNLFHDYTDVLVPLFITSRRFQGEVHFLLSDTKSWWLGRFRKVLSQLSNHEIIDTDSPSELNTIRCFPKLVVGPTFHKELGIITSSSAQHNISMLRFKELLRSAFGLRRVKTAISQRPRLLIISRKRSRVFVNERGIVSMAMSLGFDVRVGEPDMNTDMAKFARLVNSADVMIGVHGAGLTNMVYLPEGAVLIQVVPLGGLNWLAKDTFGEPSKGMGVKYLEYVIREEESTLIDEYPRDHEVIRDPYAVHKRGWGALREVYLDKQNMRLHLGRLRDTLLEAIKLLPQD